MNINHWIKQLRDCVRKVKFQDEDGSKSFMTESQIKSIFNKDTFGSYFEEGLTPQDAFETEMEEWRHST